MESNQKILDGLGSLLINKYDFDYEILKSNLNFYFNDSDNAEKIEFLTTEILENIYFQFLTVFEESEEYKLIYQKEKGKQVNLSEVSSALNSEIHGDEGWIARFSKKHKKS